MTDQFTTAARITAHEQPKQIAPHAFLADFFFEWMSMCFVSRQIQDKATTKPLQVPALIEARATLGAAIHGAHRGSRGGQVRHWIEKALELSPETWNLLQDLVEARLNRSPAVLMPGQFRGTPLTPQQGWRWPHLDAEVLRAVSDVAGIKVVPRTPAQSRIELWNPLEQFLPDVLDHQDDQGRSVIRAPWPRTDLALLANGPCSVEIILRSCGNAAIFLSGRRLAGVALRGEWVRWAVDLDVEPGLHRLTLRWPLPKKSETHGLDFALQELSRGFEHPIHPVFGEIHDMRVSEPSP